MKPLSHPLLLLIGGGKKCEKSDLSSFVGLNRKYKHSQTVVSSVFEKKASRKLLMLYFKTETDVICGREGNMSSPRALPRAGHADSPAPTAMGQRGRTAHGPAGTPRRRTLPSGKRHGQ